MVKRRSTCSTSVNQSLMSRHGMASSPICWSATAKCTAPEAEYICPVGFLSGWPVGVELVVGLPERPGSQQTHFLQAPKDVSVCSVLIYMYVQRIRGFTTMRYINLRFTYLLTVLTVMIIIVVYSLQYLRWVTEASDTFLCSIRIEICLHFVCSQYLLSACAVLLYRRAATTLRKTDRPINQQVSQISYWLFDYQQYCVANKRHWCCTL